MSGFAAADPAVITPDYLYKGSNLLLERVPVEADGVTTIAPAALQVCECELMQGARVVKKLVRGTDPELRTNGAGNKLELEITTAISRLCTRGELVERWRLGVADAARTAEPGKAVYTVILKQVFVLE